MTTLLGAFHMHSDYSHDGLDSLEQLREVSIERGIGWVGLTDHAEDLDDDIYAEYVKHCASLSDSMFAYLPGLEFRFAGYRGMHLLALGTRGWYAPKTPEDFFAWASENAQFTVLAHPGTCRYAPASIVRDRIDAVEVWNAGYNTRYIPDPRAIDLYRSIAAQRPDVVATVGLDQHDSSNDRGVRTVFEADTDPVQQLRSATFTSMGRNLTLDSRATLPPSVIARLRVQRRLLDLVNRTHDRLVFSARRMGMR